MRLDHLCDAEWTYELLSEVEGGDRRDGRVYGQGRGMLSGRISGTAVWSNHPRIRSGFALPDARGVIRLTDGGEVLFELRGLSSLRDGSGVHVMLFETAASTHLWLNDVVAVGEGVVDVERSWLSMRYYECGVELPLADLHG
jgi:hypothetical protein